MLLLSQPQQWYLGFVMAVPVVSLSRYSNSCNCDYKNETRTGGRGLGPIIVKSFAGLAIATVVMVMSTVVVVIQ